MKRFNNINSAESIVKIFERAQAKQLIQRPTLTLTVDSRYSSKRKTIVLDWICNSYITCAPFVKIWDGNDNPDKIEHYGIIDTRIKHRLRLHQWIQEQDRRFIKQLIWALDTFNEMPDIILNHEVRTKVRCPFCQVQLNGIDPSNRCACDICTKIYLED